MSGPGQRSFPVFVLAIFLYLLPALAAAGLRAEIDRNPVSLDESFTLTLTSDGDAGGNPDLSALKQDFDVRGQSNSSSMRIINGSTSRSTQWQLSLMAKRSGHLRIPSLSVGGQTSQPIDITVTAAAPGQQAQQRQDLFIEVGAQPHAAYVQQQIIVTARLYRAVDLGQGATLSDPTFPGMNAVVERLGDDHDFETLRNGLRYSVIERRYAVYPQAGGDFSSGPVVLDGDVIDQNQGGGFFSFDPFSQSSHHVRVRSNTVNLSIKPMPPGFDNGNWLPARSLSLKESWSQDPEKFSVGQPITRTLTLAADGTLASSLPAVTGAAIDGLRLYPDQPTLKNDKRDTGIMATREQKIAIIPTRGGRITLPAIDVKWWNTETGKAQLAHLPARTVSVQPGTNDRPAQPQPGAPIAATDETPGTAPPSSAALLASATASAGWWPWLSLSLGVGWLVTLLLWWRQTRNGAPQAKNRIDKVKTARQLENLLKTSCHENDAPRASSLLLSWAKLRWLDNPPTSLAEIARHCAPPLGVALRGLEKTLYAGKDMAWQDGDALWALITEHLLDTRARSAGQAQTTSLESLYKIS